MAYATHTVANLNLLRSRVSLVVDGLDDLVKTMRQYDAESLVANYRVEIVRAIDGFEDFIASAHKSMRQAMAVKGAFGTAAEPDQPAKKTNNNNPKKRLAK